jgi:hypothetical protein
MSGLHRAVVTCLVALLSTRCFDVNLLLFRMISSFVLRLHVKVLDGGLVTCFRSFSSHEVDNSAHIQLMCLAGICGVEVKEFLGGRWQGVISLQHSG